MSANYDNGVLKIKLAKKAEAKPKQIKVNVGSEKTLEAKTSGNAKPGKRFWLESRGQNIELRPGLVLVGRSSGCHIVLDDALVSRRHAAVRRDQGLRGGGGPRQRQRGGYRTLVAWRATSRSNGSRTDR